MSRLYVPEQYSAAGENKRLANEAKQLKERIRELESQIDVDFSPVLRAFRDLSEGESNSSGCSFSSSKTLATISVKSFFSRDELVDAVRFLIKAAHVAKPSDAAPKG